MQAWDLRENVLLDNASLAASSSPGEFGFVAAVPTPSGVTAGPHGDLSSRAMTFFLSDFDSALSFAFHLLSLFFPLAS